MWLFLLSGLKWKIFLIAVWNILYRSRSQHCTNTEKSICVFLVRAHHKTTGCCPSLSLEESPIISSFQLNKSLWTPRWARHLNLKAERSSFSVPWQWAPRSPGIRIHVDALRFKGASHIKAFSHSTLHFSSWNGHQIDCCHRWRAP